ncbi:MAG: hypothetical protein JWO52_1930 [Gammaproteobacteria bacterium]|nr:hypothetical protein [Gammaproteobacteria bacterium]
MELTNSKRLLYTASYVTTRYTPDEQREAERQPGGGYQKSYVLRSLDLQRPDLGRIRTALNGQRKTPQRDDLEKLFLVAQKLSDAHGKISTMELAASMAPISYEALTSFTTLSSTVTEVSSRAALMLTVANQQRKISPIGRLHLERVEMYPAGVQKGELVFTVPMAPGETISISHKEWSTSSREFEEIVQDYFESFSEKGVAEKSDASMSSENESKHSSALNFGASLTGTYTGVTLTTTLGLSKTNEERQSVKQSMQKTREVTEKASARTRKEHKVSVKIETKSGTEDRSAKTISNDSANAIRVDYYRMMRKWRTDLFRYGLRLTYDIAIPLPGVRLWALHQRVAELDRQLQTPGVFGLQPDQLTDLNWMAKALEFGAPIASVPPPPQEKLTVVPPASIIDYIPEDQASITRFGKVDFEVPVGYWLEQAAATAHVSQWTGLDRSWMWLNGSNSGNMTTGVFFGDLSELRLKQSGPMAATYQYHGLSFANLQLMLIFARTPQSVREWQRAAWTAIKSSADARHQEQLARLQQERDRLWRLLNGKDTLTLRRLEREELLRLVMQWLLGPGHPVIASPGGSGFPPGPDTLATMLTNEVNFQNGTLPTAPTFSPTLSGVSEAAWYDSVAFGDFVKFVHQAIEWESILYFLYPYFWGSEGIGRDKLLFEHGDPEHERFLRAGYVRIVLPVRPGFEEDFTGLIEKGSLGKDPTHPYLTVAEDIANFAKTNYSGIPPANPELHARPLLYPEQRATWDTMQATMVQIDAFKTKNGHYPAKLDDLPDGLPVDFWGNPFSYRMPGLGADYDLLSLGADGKAGGEDLDADISSAAGASLVATWFEYTPTSALDIAIDTLPADLS